MYRKVTTVLVQGVSGFHELLRTDQYFKFEGKVLYKIESCFVQQSANYPVKHLRECGCSSLTDGSQNFTL